MSRARTLRSSNRNTQPGEPELTAALEVVNLVDEADLLELPIPPCFLSPYEGNPSPTPQIQQILKGTPLAHISPADLSILRAKQTRLRQTRPAIEAEVAAVPAEKRRHVAKALAATLLFAQYEAGTALCVGAAGEVLTCAHCFGEDEAERRRGRYRWLLFYTGQAVLVRSRRWDERRDLALARIVAVEVDGPPQTPAPGAFAPVFTFLPVLDAKPRVRAPIACIGQPGRDDLEATTSGVKTTYNLVEVSFGQYRGLDDEMDPHDCAEIGSLMHDAWTYWGHSGAPLVELGSGGLVGLHSSWDDESGMRRGVPWVAIRAFLGGEG